jgi:hypothetical protein
MRALARAILGLAAAVTFLVSGWTLSQSPFAAPYVERTEAQVKVAVEAALTHTMDMRTVEARLRAALAEGEADEAAAILALADRRGVAVMPFLRAEVEAAVEVAEGWSACLSCAVDPAECPDLTRVAACNLPLELTPVGDAKAVWRAVDAYLEDRAIDRVDLGLGVVGLGATAAILVSGGSSATVKGGATVLRVGRKVGALPPRLADEVAVLASNALRLDRAGEAMRTRQVSLLIEPAAAARLSGVASDVGRLTDAMPLGDAFAVVRRAESADDLARLARVANATGDQTRATLAVLGKARLVRLTTRLADMAILAAALLAAVAGQVVSFAIWLLRRMLRPARGGQRGRPPPPSLNRREARR